MCNQIIGYEIHTKDGGVFQYSEDINIWADEGYLEGFIVKRNKEYSEEFIRIPFTDISKAFSLH